MHPHSPIVAAIRRGDRAAALRDIDQLLGVTPQDAELLGLRGLALALDGRSAEAADSLRRAVAAATAPAQRLKHAGNLARLLASEAALRPQLASIIEMKLPALETLAEEDRDAAVLENLCMPLAMAGQHGFVADYLAPVIDAPFVSWDLERLWLQAADQAGQHARILARCLTPGYRWLDRPEASAIACAAAAQLGRDADVNKLRERHFACVPPLVLPRQQSQIMAVVLISPDPASRALAKPLHQQHFAGNFPGQLAQHLSGRYRFISVFEGSRPGAARAEIGAGEPAIILNNCVNGEDLKRGSFARVCAQQEALGLPLVNAAEKAIHCTRVETAELLRGTPNLIVPMALRFKLAPELLGALQLRIPETIPFPIILRSVGEQEGANVHLASNPAELGSALSALLALGERDFYAIAYAGVQHGNGFFRRIRAGFVDGVPTLIRADYDDQWLVRGRKFERILDHYRRDPALFAKANAVVEQPQQLGEAAWNTLLEVGRRIPLDIFGMDFDVDSEGRVVFFESNATMLLLSNAPPDLDYPQQAQQAFLKRLDALFLKRAGISIQ